VSFVLKESDAKRAIREVLGSYVDFVFEVISLDLVIAQINGEVVVGSARSIHREAIERTAFGTRDVRVENIIGEQLADWRSERLDLGIRRSLLDQVSERLTLKCVAPGVKGIRVQRRIRV